MVRAKERWLTIAAWNGIIRLAVAVRVAVEFHQRIANNPMAAPALMRTAAYLCTNAAAAVLLLGIVLYDTDANPLSHYVLVFFYTVAIYEHRQAFRDALELVRTPAAKPASAFWNCCLPLQTMPLFSTRKLCSPISGRRGQRLRPPGPPTKASSCHLGGFVG
ncbi:uncharacterized protein LOC119402649 isoform X2 [Rhipicephalus sanguineus]|uniref:uncharacterized protein LOC119402649 isoform X2 n=1 Tax=Rhipicephalus sanguineus TaxID=34632 RepID=UPI0018959416|nr:uncharacterized protein LOC119402649 isoform X2 [Rhipicephalus sanguineus]